jgi:hypothetical protein
VYDEVADKRISFVSVDGGMGSDMVNDFVVKELEKRLGPGIYTHENVRFFSSLLTKVYYLV